MPGVTGLASGLNCASGIPSPMWLFRLQSMSSFFMVEERGEKAFRRKRICGLPSGSNWKAGQGGEGKGRDQLCGVSKLRVGTARCLEGAGGVIEWYEGGAGDATETQWIGWSLELVSQVGHVYSGMSWGPGDSRVSAVSRYIGMFALRGESGNFGNLDMVEAVARVPVLTSSIVDDQRYRRSGKQRGNKILDWRDKTLPAPINGNCRSIGIRRRG